MQGTLSTNCLAELFREIFHVRRSGELVLKHEAIEKHIYFERGQVVFASSNRPEERIGETLVRYRKLTRDQVEALAAQLQPGQRMGRTLVEMNIITERELVSYVTLQIIDIIYSIFNWHDGNYQFVEGEGRAPEELKMKFSTATLILEGIRRIEEFDTIRRGIGSPALPLLPTAAGRSKLQAIAFSPLELTLINMIKEPMDLLKVLVTCKERPEKVLQAIYGLLAIGILEQGEDLSSAITRDHGTLRETGPQMRMPNTSPHQVAPPPGVEGALLTEIETLKQKIATRDVRVILGITADNNPNEIYDSYLKLAMKFHPDKFTTATPALKAEADYIFNAVSESYNYVRANGVPVTPPVSAPAPAIAPAPAMPMYGAPPQPNYNPSGQMPNIRLQQQTGGHPTAPYGAPTTYPPQQPGYPAPPPANPMAQFQGSKRSSITRAVSDEIEFKGQGREPMFPGRKTVDVERAISEMLDYFDDRRAPLFAADALSTLLRTKAPQHIGRRELVETIITWARNKASVMGWPMAVILLRVVSLIKQAEQSQLIQDFDGASFYPGFVQELAGYCTPPEADEFMRGVGSV